VPPPIQSTASASPVPPAGWEAQAATLAELAGRQLFFIGASPRSGTTWLQLLLDAHPAVSCRGEGHFGDSLAPALARLAREHNALIDRKNRRIFAEVGGYPLLEPADLDLLFGTAVLLALHRQSRTKPDARTVGEKTPDNVRIFPLLLRLFPRARFIHLLRDPRDVLVSAWHHNARLNPGWSDARDIQGFVREFLPVVMKDMETGEAFAAEWPDQCLRVTYEAMSADAPAAAGRIFGFLGVDAGTAVSDACVAAAEFVRLSGGRARGEEAATSHFRKGIAYGWRDVLTEETNRFVIDRLGPALARYAWPER
jgi:hypothetical protein